MKNSIIKKTGIYFIGNFSSKILMAIIIPIYAFYVTSEDLGNFDYAQTLMSIFVPIAFLSVWDAVLKYSIDKKYNEKEIINNVLVLTGIATIIVWVISFVLCKIGRLEHFASILLMFLCYGYGQIWQYFARGLGKTKLYVFSGITSTIVNFTLISICVIWLKMGLSGLYIAYIASQLSIVMVIEGKLGLLRQCNFKDCKKKIIIEMICFSAPLTLNTISSWLFNGFSRFIITNKLGAFENGLYAFSNKFAIVITMFGSVITMAVIEEAIISKNNKVDGIKESKSAEELYIAILSLAIIAMPAIALFYEFISSSEYYSSIVYVPLLLLYAVFSTLASNIGAQFQALEKTQYQFITTIIGSGACAVVSICLIDRYGIYCVVVSQVIGALLMVISRYNLVNKYMAYKFNIPKMIFVTVIYLGLSYICTRCNLTLDIIVLLVSLVLCFMLNKKMLINLFSTVINKLKR